MTTCVVLETMESRVLPCSVVAVAKRKRTHWEQSFISSVVATARQIGAKAAVIKANVDRAVENQVSEETVRTWVHRWTKEGAFWEGEGKKRGRPTILSTAPLTVGEELRRQLGSVRDQGGSVTGRVAAAVCRAALAEKAPSLLERNGGDVKFSVASGRRFLLNEGQSWRKKSSSRIIPPAEIGRASCRERVFVCV